MATSHAKIEGVKVSDLVAIKLAHPLNKNDRVRLGLDADAETEPNDTVKVRDADALTLINAGYAQVDPEDIDAVRKTLAGSSDEGPVEVTTNPGVVPGEPTVEPAQGLQGAVGAVVTKPQPQK